MKKLLIASAVSAAFAAPTVALAQAARAPTLSQVLDASGITVSGYLDAAYSYASRNGGDREHGQHELLALNALRRRSVHAYRRARGLCPEQHGHLLRRHQQ